MPLSADYHPLPMTLEIRCWTVQYKTVIEKNLFLQPIIDFQKETFLTSLMLSNPIADWHNS